MAALVLRHGAARRLGLGAAMIQRPHRAAAEGRRRLGTSFMHTKDQPIAEEGKMIIKEAGPKRDGYDWREFPYSSALATLGNNVIKGGLFFAVASEMDFYWLFGIERPEEKKRA